MDIKSTGRIPPYDKKYYLLCDAASKPIDLLPQTPDTKDVRELLQNALYQAEELYVDAES